MNIMREALEKAGLAVEPKKETAQVIRLTDEVRELRSRLKEQIQKIDRRRKLIRHTLEMPNKDRWQGEVRMLNESLRDLVEERDAIKLQLQRAEADWRAESQRVDP